MEKELNIAAILKDKPENTKLWRSIYGEAYLKKINSNKIVNITHHGGYNVAFTENGKSWNDGECVLFPSKSMRDWSKFAWKKGDVLVSNGEHIIFEKWKNNSYTTFLGVFDSIDNNSLICLTSVWEKETNEAQINKYISQIEKAGGGKLNLSTLEIEKPQFKDGDIVVADYVEGVVFICICNKVEDNFMYCHARMNSHNKDLYLKKAFLKVNLVNRNPRPATDSEKQQLFDALAKENKTWDAEKKQIVDLPKKCEFKAFDKVLVRCKDYQKWKVDFFSHYDDSCKGFPYVCVSSRKSFCIPYNDQTAHLLGTTDDWEGGEE